MEEEMTEIECGIKPCKYNDKSKGKYGICKNEKVTLKLRFAGDFGKGAIFFIECLMYEGPKFDE